MGRAIDTILGQITNQTGLTAITLPSGDTLQVKQFADGSKAYMENVIVKGTAARTARILSPQLHDPVRGLTFVTAQAPSVFSTRTVVARSRPSTTTLIWPFSCFCDWRMRPSVPTM